MEREEKKPYYQHYLSKLQNNILSSEEIGTFEIFFLLLLYISFRMQAPDFVILIV